MTPLSFKRAENVPAWNGQERMCNGMKIVVFGGPGADQPSTIGAWGTPGARRWKQRGANIDEPALEKKIKNPC